MNPQTWLKNKWPNMRVCDVNWTMERYDYPQNVRQWIFENWIKMNDKGGGTYSEPEYFYKKYENNSISTGIENPEEADILNHLRAAVRDEGVDSDLACLLAQKLVQIREEKKRLHDEVTSLKFKNKLGEGIFLLPDNDGREYAKEYKKTAFVKGMDDNNKKALEVMATQGTDAAIKHMFKHPETGRQLSYGEMRMFYG